ncbi:ras association domain-containing protein 8-like isoform X1 [Brienomyrus brachyistius]|uniref:ras association domain-containing protein 8-like isoform X1 n=1 Tax=Brienomyrus brachyistius TaxID=42636 RepID=UPI0020B31BBC|nr:ras association domain-containing protein 8-like isoform X1 [Brienomyrus brachyistius]
MRFDGMELKVWVDGVQRVVCGVSEVTTCQEVVVALAQAIGRTGRYTLTERWRGIERPLAPFECPIASLNQWGPHAGDVQLVLRRTGSTATERPASDGPAHIPERVLYRQSLPPLARLRPPTERSFRRREPKRKSVTIMSGARGFLDMFGRSRDSEAKQHLMNHSNSIATASGLRISPTRELAHLVQLQKEKLRMLEQRIGGCESELRAWAERGGGAAGVGTFIRLQEEVLAMQRKVQRNEVEISEGEFWENELQIEQENERQLRERLQELLHRTQDCEVQLGSSLGRIQDMEAGVQVERLQQETQEMQKLNEEEVRVRVLKLKAEVEAQTQQASRLESSCRAVERSLGQSARRLQEKEQELEQLTKELRQVNLQQFIQQTGSRVSVTPSESSGEPGRVSPGADDATSLWGSLKRPASSQPLSTNNLQDQEGHLPSGFSHEGIYV